MLPRIIKVIDLETTGLDGISAGDHILDFAVVNVDTVKKTVEPVVSSYIHDINLTEEKLRSCWVVQNGYLDADAVLAQDRRLTAETICRDFLGGYFITSYNRDFDIGKFLSYSLDMEFYHIYNAPCVMLSADQLIEIPRRCEGAWPTLKASYEYLCPDDPVRMKGKQLHRALPDAMMAGYVLLALADRGLYDIKCDNSPERIRPDGKSYCNSCEFLRCGKCTLRGY